MERIIGLDTVAVFWFNCVERRCIVPMHSLMNADEEEGILKSERARLRNKLIFVLLAIVALGAGVTIGMILFR